MYVVPKSVTNFLILWFNLILNKHITTIIQMQIHFLQTHKNNYCTHIRAHICIVFTNSKPIVVQTYMLYTNSYNSFTNTF
jgi:ABC-type arginine/histidine transport system permease subunit